jgi:hypothetical protein
MVREELVDQKKVLMYEEIANRWASTTPQDVELSLQDVMCIFVRTLKKLGGK